MGWKEFESGILASPENVKKNEPQMKDNTGVGVGEITLSCSQKEEGLDAVDALIDKLSLREALEAVKTDVWGEGEIVETLQAGEANFARSLVRKTIRLTSAPYPIVRVQKKEIEIDEEQSLIEMSATQSYNPDSTGLSAHYYFSTLLDLTDEELSMPLEKLVAKYGFMRGVTKRFNPPHAPQYNTENVLYDSKKKRQMEPGLYALKPTLLADVQTIIAKKSTPKDLRQFGLQRIKEIPAKYVSDHPFQGRRLVNPKDLRQWESDMIGRSKAKIAIGRIFSKS